MSSALKLTATHRRNLTKLADKLESLPPRYRHFQMAEFFEPSDDLDIETKLANEIKYAKRNGGVDQFECHTVACALGHGPAAGILFRPSDFNTVGNPVWFKYMERFLPMDPARSIWWRLTEMLPAWLFGAEWAPIDNHHYGAAARIRYLLANNEPPKGFVPGGPRPRDKKAYRNFDKRYNSHG